MITDTTSKSSVEGSKTVKAANIAPSPAKPKPAAIGPFGDCLAESNKNTGNASGSVDPQPISGKRITGLADTSGVNVSAEISTPSEGVIKNNLLTEHYNGTLTPLFSVIELNHMSSDVSNDLTYESHGAMTKFSIRA